MPWLESLCKHWELIAFLAYVLLNILNKLTKHWTLSRGSQQVALVVMDVLSVLSSKDVVNYLKPPLSTTSQPRIEPETDYEGRR